jgi:hypothetical protein
VTEAEVESVAINLFLEYIGGSAVDLGDVDIWIEASGSRRVNDYDSLDGFGRDTDDGSDSDAANDWNFRSGVQIQSRPSISFSMARGWRRSSARSSQGRSCSTSGTKDRSPSRA